jgi:sugar phosphate isomerase/epimerase
MARLLSLHHLTVLEADPAEAISIAAAAGFDQVCLFLYSPSQALPGRSKSSSFPLVTETNKAEVLARLKQCNIGVSNIEFFPVTSDVPLENYRAAFALGAEVGAKRAVTHIHDSNDERAVRTVRKIADLAAEYRLTLALEFMGLTPACNSIQRAAWFVEQAGKPNFGIGVDALHLARTGGTPADIRAIPSHFFSYSQICDGHGLHVSSDYLSEGLDREMPGDGDFPLLEMIEALPLATALDVEIPSARLVEKGVSGIERAKLAMARTRALIDRAKVSR